MNYDNMPSEYGAHRAETVTARIRKIIRPHTENASVIGGVEEIVERIAALEAELRHVEQMHLTLCYELMDLASVRDNYVSGYEQSLEEGHKLVERVALVEKAYCDMQTERDEARAELEALRQEIERHKELSAHRYERIGTLDRAYQDENAAACHARMWSRAWKAKAKQKHEWCGWQAESISTMIMERVTPGYLPKSTREAVAERDEARAETTAAYGFMSKLTEIIRNDAGEESWLKALDLIGKKSASATELVSMDILYTGATECARLRDVLSNLLTGIKAYLADEGREIATLHNYGPADAWFKDAIQAAQREFPLPFDGAVSGQEPDGLTVLSATEPTPEHTVIIPARTEHNGIWATSVRLKWICPVCGGSRGKISEGLSYDGSRRLSVSRWLNPCGHIDAYVDIRKEAAENGMNERAESAAPLTPPVD